MSLIPRPQEALRAELDAYRAARPTAERPFLISPFCLHAIARQGYGRVAVKVLGYWSSDSIEVHIQREFTQAPGAAWRVTINHASGGRDTKELADDAAAVAHFAAGLLAAGSLARMLRAASSMLNAEFEAHQAQLRAAEQAERERIAADPAMGHAAAKLFVITAQVAARGHAPMGASGVPRWFRVSFVRRGGAAGSFLVGAGTGALRYERGDISMTALASMLARDASATTPEPELVEA